MLSCDRSARLSRTLPRQDDGADDHVFHVSESEHIFK